MVFAHHSSQDPAQCLAQTQQMNESHQSILGARVENLPVLLPETDPTEMSWAHQLSAKSILSSCWPCNTDRLPRTELCRGIELQPVGRKQKPHLPLYSLAFWTLPSVDVGPPDSHLQG